MMKRNFGSPVIVAILAVFAVLLAGCAGYEYKKGYGMVPVELRDADRAVDKAKMEGKDKECPEEYSKASVMRDNAYETHYACNTPEAMKMAAEAATMAEGLCPAKPMPKDSDGDGVYDKDDKCPGTPAGVKVNSMGCPVDSDGDGVYDYKDKCPGTPKGVKVDSNGCPLDSDGDGVYDYMDKCSGTPAGAKVNSLGCPLDTDGDGVFDHLDRCPGTPPGIKVDAVGCPLPMKEKVSIDLNVEFANNSADVQGVYDDHLKKVTNFLKAYPGAVAQIQGHTDSVGSADYNQKLSQKRAESVMKYLIERGVRPSQLKAVGYGESRPIADNSTKAGRQKNRRVVAVISTTVVK